MLFHQSAAPAGWTKDTAATLNDHALRIVTSTAWSAGSNGTDNFSTTFSASKATEDYTLMDADIPKHTHSYTAPSNTTGAANTNFVGLATGGGTTGEQATGDGAHSHDITMDVKYANFIIATKD